MNVQFPGLFVQTECSMSAPLKDLYFDDYADYHFNQYKDVHINEISVYDNG